MNKYFFPAFVLLSLNLSFSQNLYEKCVEECMRAGWSEATCRLEECDPRDTTIVINIVPGKGNPLFLVSYELKGPAPVIDGSLMSRDGDPATSDAMDEWKEACSRTLILNDSTQAQLFLVNSKDTLYVGMTYEHGNNGDGCGVRLYFDEGNSVPPPVYDGSGDLRLSAPGGICNEQGCAVNKSGGGVALQDLCWNGTSWVQDGDGQIDFKGNKAYFNSSNKVHHNEFAIPLNNLKADNVSNSDLNVNYDDMIGFYLEVIKMGTGAGIWHWIETNGLVNRPDSFPYWAKIQLSVKRDYFTFYTGRSSVVPVIDGSIQEAAWNGAYQREMVLSNYHYGFFRSKIWCLEDSAQDTIYIGVRVFDKTQNPSDNCQIFFEETGEDTTSIERDYDLDNSAENSLKITNNNQFTDIHWRLDLGGWLTDVEAADSQSARAGQADTFTDYEFRVIRSAGAQDIDIPRKGFLGFLLRYHDADKTLQDYSNYYWEYTTNNDAQLLDQQGSLSGNPLVYIATGWTNLQLGGPFLQIVKPTSPDDIKGVVSIEINSGTDSLTSVIAFVGSDTTIKVTLIYQGNGVWTGSLDVTNVPAGDLTLVIRAVTVAGITVERIINKAVTPGVIFVPRQRYPQRPGTGIVVQPAKQGVRFLVTTKQPGNLVLEAFSVTGRNIWSYRNSNAGLGQHLIEWNNPGRSPSNGTYLLRLTSGNEKVIRTFTVFR